MDVRTIGVGLLLGAFLILKLSVRFIEWVMLVSPEFAHQIAVRTLSESVAHVAGIGLILPAAFVSGCLGVGLAVAGIFYPFMEQFVFDIGFSVVKSAIRYFGNAFDRFRFQTKE